MELELICYTPNGNRHPVVAYLTPDTSVFDLRTALNTALRPGGGAVSKLYRGGEVLADTTPIKQAGLVHGTVLGVGRPAVTLEDTSAEWELVTIGGLHGGVSVPAVPGQRITIGRGTGSDLSLADGEVSRDHAVVSVREADEGGIDAEIAGDGARNGVWFDGARLTGAHRLPPEYVVGIGESRLVLRRAPAADADLSTDVARGGRVFNRPPRIEPAAPVVEIAVPVPPVRPDRQRLPWLGVALPMVVGLGVFLLVPSGGYWLLLTALSPVLAIVNLIGDQRGGRRAYRKRLKEFRRSQDLFNDRLREQLARDAVEQRGADPDPSWLLRVAGAPSACLWERSPQDPDFLVVRVGVHDHPARIVLRPDPSATPADAAAFTLPALPLVPDVPAAVDLRAVRFLGISGPPWATSAAVRAMVARCAALHSPAELAIVVIAVDERLVDWEWASWLPHTQTVAGSDRRTVVAVDRAENVLAELRRRLGQRGADLRRPSVLLVLDGATLLRRHSEVAAVLRDGADLGVVGLCLTADTAALPAECGASLLLSPSGTRASLDVHGAEPVRDVLVDGISEQAAARLGRALAPLRTSGVRDTTRDLPRQVRFSKLVGLTLCDAPNDDAERVSARWAQAPDRRTCRALLGTGADGALTVDLTEDGPHGLVAGTTGAGKSELLRTFVTSLALTYPPEVLNVILVDFKGGSAFAECADLPHCVGMVTDLDDHLVRRVLTSLSAELRRREALLAAANAPDVDTYWARTGAPLPRLVVVIDEFATLIETIPDFESRVVDLGRRARSLGVHLVLATQHPGSGIVSEGLRANLAMRICLRVSEAAHSTDLVGIPDAARITAAQKGRAFLRGAMDSPTPFQVGSVSWPRCSERADGPAVVVRSRRNHMSADRDVEGAQASPGARTDLSALVAAIRTAAIRSGSPAPARPWLPPLPDVITVDDVPAASGAGVPIGVVDQPSVPAQRAFEFDIAGGGPVVIAGTNRTGRSTALRTLTAQLAKEDGPHAVHVYGIDCGGRSLLPLTSLPHVGAVVGTDEPDRVRRLVEWLDAEVHARQHTAPAERSAHPLIVLLVDGLHTYLRDLAERDGGRLVDLLERLLRHGQAARVVTVITTDRTGFTQRVATAVENRLVLRQAERDDVVTFGLPARGLPERMPAGRGVWTTTNEEVQIAMLTDDPSAAAQDAAIHRLGERLSARWVDLDRRLLPRSFAALPARISMAGAEELRAIPRRTSPLVWTPAIGGDELTPVDVDLADCTGSFVIAGPGGTGRSNALEVLVRGLAGRGEGTATTALILPRLSPLRGLSGLPGVHLAPTEPALATWLAEFVGSSHAPLIVVDDAELVTDHAVTDLLEKHLRRCRDGGAALVAAVTINDLLLNRFRGWLAQMLRSRCGLLLSPRGPDGEVFDLRLPTSTAESPPGRGLLVQRGITTAVQVTLAMDERAPAQ